MEIKSTNQQLIQGIVSGDPKAVNDIYLKYREKVFSIAYKFTKNVEDSNDISQEVFIKAITKIATLKKDDKLGAWIAEIARNCSRNYVKKSTREKEKIARIKIPYITGDGDQTRSEKELIEKKLIKISKIEELKISNPQFLKELERSLDYVLHIYWLKEEYDLKQKNVLPFIKTWIILVETKNSIKEIFAPPTTMNEVKKIYKILKPKFHEDKASRTEKLFHERKEPSWKLQAIRGHFLGRDPYPNELSEINRQLFLEEDNKDFLKLLSQYLTELIKRMNDEIQGASSLMWFLLPDDFKKILGNINKINIDPPALIFRIWTRAFRKNRKTNLKFIKGLMLEFKKKFKKTLWGYQLFKPLDESFNIETWRKKILQKTEGNKLYDELADLVYKKSFVEKVPIYPWR